MLFDAVSDCQGDSTKLYDLYGTLSNQIHGRPWSGPSLILTPGLTAKDECLISKFPLKVLCPVSVLSEDPGSLLFPSRI
jgi:hypothetical protein